MGAQAGVKMASADQEKQIHLPSDQSLGREKAGSSRARDGPHPVPAPWFLMSPRPSSVLTETVRGETPIGLRPVSSLEGSRAECWSQKAQTCALLPPLPGGAVDPMLFLSPHLKEEDTSRQDTEQPESPHMAELQPCFQVLPGLRDPKGGLC